MTMRDSDAANSDRAPVPPPPEERPGLRDLFRTSDSLRASSDAVRSASNQHLEEGRKLRRASDQFRKAKDDE